jgi:hypothetical protein
MNDLRTLEPMFEPSDMLARYVEALVDGRLTIEQHADLARRLASDPTARNWFVDYMQLHACLTWDADDLDLDLDDTSSNDAPLGQTAPAATFPATIWHGATSYFSSGWPLAYLVATVVVAVGLFIASLTPQSHSALVASKSLPARSGALHEPEMQFVGHITGMVGCRWVQNPKSEITEQKSLVAIGDEFALSSGLLEITYDTGTKVILQGPVTYEVESPDGGFLSLGKLTARVEKKAEGGRRKAEESNPQSLIPNPSHSPFPLPPSTFVVRTPTALVTDLGTEFGVEVNQEGLTRVHVLQGIVDARVVNPRNGAESHRRLVEGAAVEIGRSSGKLQTIAFAPKPFTRRLQPATDLPAEAAYIKAVLADKPLGYWPLNEPAGARRFVDHSGHGIHGYAMGKVLAGEGGPLPGNSRAIELDGNGYIDLGRHDEFAMKNDFTVEAWVWIGKVKRQGTVFCIYEDGANPNGWGLGAGRGVVPNGPEKPVAVFFQSYPTQQFDFPLRANEAIEHRWLHAATVYDRDDTVHLYLNGERRAATAGGKPFNLGAVWLAIGGSELSATPEQVDTARWRGRLAHVAVYPHVLTTQQIQNHYKQRSSVSDSDSPPNQKEKP